VDPARAGSCATRHHQVQISSFGYESAILLPGETPSGCDLDAVATALAMKTS
jgi:hypothetical protein